MEQVDWQRDLFPSAGARSGQGMLNRDAEMQSVEMANFGVIDDGGQRDYIGQGPGYAVDPDYEGEQVYPPMPGQAFHPVSTAIDRVGSGRSAQDTTLADYSIMAELPSRREQAHTAATIRRRQTIRGGRNAASGGGRESPYFEETIQDEEVLPSMRRSTDDRSSHAHPPAGRRSMRRPRAQGEGRRVSAYRQVKWEIGLKWKSFKESMSNFFYHLGFWRATMKRVEGRFGTGVVSYFLFLRWLVFLDILLAIMVVSFVFVPQLTTGKTKTSVLNNNVVSTQWYSYIQQTISGEGYLEDTELFMGVYTNGDIGTGSYSMPYAYLLTIFSIFLLSLILLVYSMSKAYRESYVQDAGGLYSYSNKTFGAWEFTISDESTARLKAISIKKDFEEELNNEKALSAKWTFEKTLKAYSRRVVVNLLIFLMWVGAGASIFFATKESIDANEELSMQTGSVSYTAQFSLFIRSLAASLTIAAFDVIFPTIFQQLALLEMWRTPRTEVRATLLRTIAMRLSSLGVLMASVFIVIERCRNPQSNTTMITEAPTNATMAVMATMAPNLTTVATMTGTAINTTATPTSAMVSNCQPCWESFAGQQLYQLTLIDFFIIVAVTFIGESVWRVAANRSNFVKTKIGPPEFFIAKSVLELLYAQALLWLGVFFSPLIPVICILKFFIFFYAKKWSLFANLKPSDRPYRAARNSNIFRGLLLLTLFLCLIPIGYAVVRIQPSEECGPFRKKEHIYDIIPELIDRAPDWLNTIINFVGSAAFIAPLFIFLLLVVYYFRALSKAQKENIKLLKEQLQLEGRDKQFLIGKVQRMQTAYAALSGT